MIVFVQKNRILDDEQGPSAERSWRQSRSHVYGLPLKFCIFFCFSHSFIFLCFFLTRQTAIPTIKCLEF
jgi:hypothetical protein